MTERLEDAVRVLRAVGLKEEVMCESCGHP